jgi:dolichol-phosphate mannosyltransferase
MISVIFPVYNEQANLPELYKRLDETVAKIDKQEFEFIFVDDCSTDDSPAILKRLRESDARVRIVRFARNCGSHAAIAYGLNCCRGDAAIVLAADLQDPPSLIWGLIDEWNLGFQLVWGLRSKREGERFLTLLCSKMYYALMNWLTNVKMAPLGSDVFLADRAVIEAFKRVTEKHTSVFMALAWLGFKQTKIEYTKDKRFAGQSKWRFGQKLKLTVDSLLAFSDVPIRYMSLFGVLTALLGFGYAGYVFWSYIHGSPVEGWSSLIVAILILGGVQMIMLGVLGEYVWRTYDESRCRPRHIVEYEIG